MTFGRELKAFATATLMAAIVFDSIVFAYLLATGDMQFSSDNIFLFIYIYIASLIPVAISGFLIGLPIAMILRWIGVISIVPLLILATISGGLVSFMTIGFFGNSQWLIPGMFAGLSAGIVWWVIAENAATRDA
ncbi:hypothetical protein MKP08_10815 [Erythrobacter sp. LQ02-29]|uniref:hypothetical protein n=1 Tax=Erythrobacter sp. LQ02-29 TaxID=2920384 RepID=UPI001F4DA62E|nr:hypothetical protein [Erythrobacter sp. LQ02-29]MCP9223242.1 hypothetical protein [Erythrobacter sp. LQ02-29]